MRTRELPYKSNVVQEQKEKEYYRRRGDIMKGAGSDKQKNFKKSTGTQELSNVEDYEITGPDTEGVWKDSSGDREAYDSDDSISVTSNEEVSNTEESDTIPSSTVMDLEFLHAFADHKKDSTPVDKKQFACLKKILPGKCESTSCPYGHKQEVLLKGAAEMKDKMMAYLSANSSSNPAGMKILQRN